MSKYRYNALHAGLLAVLLGIVLILPAVVKFGGMFMIRGDYINQTVTRMITAKRMFSLNDLSLWNWNNFLGTSYNGSLGNLLSYNAIGLLFPEKLMPYAAMLVQCVRLFVTGVSAYALLRRFVKTHVSALIGTLLYAFSGYAIASLEFIAFYSTMSVFPLLLLAVEKRFTDERYKYSLIPATCVNLLASSYLFIGSAFALLVYALIRFFTCDEWKKNRRFGMILLCLCEFFIGALICGFTVSSFVNSMLTTSRAAASLSSSAVSSGKISDLLIPRHLFDVIAGLFVPAASNRVTAFFTSTKWYSMQAYLPVFGFALCFASLLRNKLRDSLNLILIAYIVISIIPLLNNASSFYGNGYTRWWYALTLIMAVITAREFEALNEDTSKGFAVKGTILQWAALLLIPALFYAVFFLKDTGVGIIKRMIAVFLYHDYSFGRAEDLFRIFSIVAGIVMTAALTFIIISKNARRYALLIVCCCIVLYGAGFVALNNSDDPAFDTLFNSPRTDKEVKSMRTVVDEYYGGVHIQNEGPYEYRVDFPDVLYNYAVMINEPSITFFESTIDSDAARFAVFAGMGEQGSVLYKPNDNCNALRTLLSVRYYYNYMPEDETVVIPEGFYYVYSDKDTDVYENESFIPFGFAYDDYITEDELFDNENSGVELLLHTLVIESKDEEYVSQFLPHCDIIKSDINEDVAARRRIVSSSFGGDSNGFTASFVCEKDEMIFFSVPYDEGWRVSVDGEAVKTVRADLGFFALVVPKGEHEVKAVFNSASVTPGLICSAFGIVCAVCYFVISERANRRRMVSVNKQ